MVTMDYDHIYKVAVIVSVTVILRQSRSLSPSNSHYEPILVFPAPAALETPKSVF